MKFKFIEEISDELPVDLACDFLKVSRSGYYAHHLRKPSRRTLENQSLTVLIHQLFEAGKNREGSPRITAALKRLGHCVNKKRVERIMKIEKLVAKVPKRFKKTTDSDHPHPPSPNLLKHRGLPSEPNQIWVSDITYLWTDEGWLYLCVILDLFSRKIVGWSLSENMKTEMVSSALRMAVMRRRPKTELLFHSDRGSQYASEDFRKNLGSYKITQSMSAAGRCYDNAFAESFFHSFKTERVFGRQFYSRVEARKEVFEYLEIYYNRSRLHSSLGYLTPVEFEEKIKQAA